jgi:hypothetical protein
MHVPVSSVKRSSNVKPSFVKNAIDAGRSATGRLRKRSRGCEVVMAP